MNLIMQAKLNKKNGAEGEIRTRTSFRTLEPESSASTNSATPGKIVYNYKLKVLGERKIFIMKTTEKIMG